MFKPLFITTFLLSLICLILFLYHEHSNSTNSIKSNFAGQKLLEELDTKLLNKINIRGKGSNVSLIQLQGGGWEEESLQFEADFSSIQDLLIRISQIKLGDLISNNAEHHARFKLVDPPENIEKWTKDLHGNSVTLMKGDGTIILSLLLGKNRQNGEGQYIRHNGSDKIFLIPESLSIITTTDNWLNKELLKIDSNLIANIKLKDKLDRILNLNRENATAEWESSGEATLLDKSKIKNVLNRLSNLSFSKLLSSDLVNEKKLNQSEKILFVTLFDGRIYTLKILNNTESNGNYILSLRMGILQEASEKNIKEGTKGRQEMESFNKKMNGRFFEISSWEGKELLISND